MSGSCAAAMGPGGHGRGLIAGEAAGQRLIPMLLWGSEKTPGTEGVGPGREWGRFRREPWVWGWKAVQTQGTARAAQEARGMRRRVASTAGRQQRGLDGSQGSMGHVCIRGRQG